MLASSCCVFKYEWIHIILVCVMNIGYISLSSLSTEWAKDYISQRLKIRTLRCSTSDSANNIIVVFPFADLLWVIITLYHMEKLKREQPLISMENFYGHVGISICHNFVI